MRRFFLLLVVSFLFANIKATHNRAGEITYVQISDFTYEITLTTFTYSLSQAQRPTLDIEWGDNTVSTIARMDPVFLPNYYQKNVYISRHTYPGPGVYKIIMQDPNRNAGVKNIPNSVNVVFSISTVLIVNPAMGKNSTPILLNPPYDKAAYGQLFIHNPGAYDPDGDSLSYQLTTCTREDGKKIENYTLPPATHSIRVDSISGDLIWDSPADTGKFNVSMEIQEWRNGIKIGIVVRDMQIEVYNTNNKAPVIGPLKNWCVEVGTPVDFLMTATDPNKDSLALTSTSGVFTLPDCKATFTQVDSKQGFASSRFRWVPCFQSVRHQPYNLILKADDYNSEVRLSDIDNINIRVIGPPPKLLTAIPEGKFIRLGWATYPSGYIAGYSIYRTEGPSGFTPDSCSYGIPSSTGFKKVGYIGGAATTSFVDTENGQGLQFGKEYAYRIVAVYPNGTESKASNEILSSLVSGVPTIVNVSVIATDPVNGSIFVAWKKLSKKDLDTIPAGPNLEYRIYRANGVTGTDYQLIRTLTTSNLNDTSFTDTNINTSTTGFIYKIELWNADTARHFPIGEPAYASSLFMTVTPGDRKAKFFINRNVPWINTTYDLFRLNNSTGTWDKVGSTSNLNFIDPGLVNGQQYCYYVRSTGSYPAIDMPKNLVNLSERACITAVDNEAPCPPVLNIASQCDSLYNTLRWTLQDSTCSEDIKGYRIYYKKTMEETASLLIDLPDKNIFTYIHKPGDIIAACYQISGYDSNGNEGERSGMMCIDTCDFYEIPNVFTPNGDDQNDVLVAKTSGLVEKIDFKLFNRNGLMLFSTFDPRINWDGTYKGKIVSPGVYFYQCDVYERRISGLELFHLSGFVHVITEADSKLKPKLTK